MSIIILFLSISAFYRWLTGFGYFDLIGINFRDYVEIFRYLPITICFLRPTAWKNIKPENFIDASLVYCTIDGIISFFQFIGLEVPIIQRLLVSLYYNEVHFTISLGESNRALGLSPGPGQHGTMMLLFYIIFLCDSFLYNRRPVLNFVGVIGSLLIIILAQVQTAFVSIAIVTPLVIISSNFSNNKSVRYRAYIILAIFTCLLVWLFAFSGFLQNFAYLNSLFEQGLGRSSYQIRLKMWSKFFDMTREKPQWIISGWGKDYFGSDSGHMDSDLVYIYCIYGLIFASAFFLSIIYFSATFLRELNKNISQYPFRSTLFFIILSGLIMSWSLSFFIDIKVINSVGLMISAAYGEQKRFLKLNNQQTTRQISRFE
jgi:hypothetical protein